MLQVQKPLYHIKIWKVLTTDNVTLEYSNQYVFEAENDLGESALMHMAKATAQAERLLHLSHVAFRRATVGIYEPEKPGKSTEYLYSVNLAVSQPYGERELIEPVPPHWALRVVKQTNAYRRGSLWYFGCLNMSDVEIGSGDRWKLTTASWFQDVIDYWFHSYYFAEFPARLVVPQWGTGVPQSAHIQPCTMIVSGLTLANARDRSRAKMQGLGVSTFQTTAQALDRVTNALQFVGDWLALGTEFNPTSVRGMVEDAIAMVAASASAVEQLTSHPENDINPEPKTPIPRWGIDAEGLWMLACSTKNKIKGWTQAAVQIEPYIFVDGETYYTLDALQSFFGILKEIRERAIELNDYDFFNIKLMPPPMAPCS